MTFAQGIDNSAVGDKTLTLTGSGSVDLGRVDALTASNDALALTTVGTLAVEGSVQATATTIRQKALSIGTGSPAKLTIVESSPTSASLVPSGNDAMVSVVRSLSLHQDTTLAYTATLDLTNNDLILDYSDTDISPLAQIEAMVRSGYNDGDWQGKGLTSSVAANGGGLYALVVWDNNRGDGFFTSFDGVTVGTQTVIVKFSWVADLDLDGVVTSNDAIVFANSYTEGAPATHSVGDLNYNGVFDTSDAILFANAYSESLAHLPEPASLGVLALGSALLLMKRRK